MEFYRTFGGAELRPREYAEAQLGGGGVERVEFVLEPETVARGTSLAAGEQFAGQLLVERVGLLPRRS